MKRTSLSLSVTLALALLLFASSQKAQPGNFNPSGMPAPAFANPVTQTAKAKKVLVRELPAAMEGMVLENGVFRLKSGYKFVPQANNTVAVALQSGGRGVTGSFDCFCSKEGGGGCSATTVGGTISCGKSKTTPCSDDCVLRTTINGNKTRLALY
jgi:hypothetical protein